MAATSGRMAASGLVGAFTTLFTTAAKSIIPDVSLRPVISILAGISASIFTFELLSWIVLFRLERARASIGRLIPLLQSTQEEIIRGMTTQKELMKQNNASAANLRTIEKMQIDCSEELAKALLELQRKNLDLIREVGGI